MIYFIVLIVGGCFGYIIYDMLKQRTNKRKQEERRQPDVQLAQSTAESREMSTQIEEVALRNHITERQRARQHGVLEHARSLERGPVPPAGGSASDITEAEMRRIRQQFGVDRSPMTATETEAAHNDSRTAYAEMAVRDIRREAQRSLEEYRTGLREARREIAEFRRVLGGLAVSTGDVGYHSTAYTTIYRNELDSLVGHRADCVVKDEPNEEKAKEGVPVETMTRRVILTEKE